MFLEIYRIDLFLTCLLSLNLWLEYLLNTFCDSSIFMYVYNILNLCLMYMNCSSVICMNESSSFMC